MRNVARPVRQLAAVALLIAVVGGAWFLALVPLAAHFSGLSEQIDSERTTLGRFAAIAALQGRLAETERAGRAAGESPAYLKGQSDQLRGASLQTVLAGIAGENGVRLASTRTLTPVERNELKFIGVRVQFIANIDQLREILYAAEARQPFLFVEGLNVRTVSALANDPEHAGKLDVSLDVYGAAPRRKS